MKIGIITRSDYRNTGIEIFERNTVDWLVENIEGAEKLEYSRPTWFPLSLTLHNLTASRRLKNMTEGFDRVFIPAQDRVMFDPEKVEAEVIPFVHDILPVTTMYKRYEGKSWKQRLRGYPSTITGTRYMKFLSKCNRVFTASEVTAEELKNRTAFDGAAEVIYQGVDHFPQKNTDERDIDLLYVGSTIHRKNPGFLKEVLKTAKKESFNVAWVNYHDIGLPGKGYVNIDDQKLAELYSRTRFYLHPSLAEGFGRTPVEAQRNGAIPLALDKKINHEVLGSVYEDMESATWFQVANVQDVIDKLRNSKEEDLLQIRENCKRNSDRFTWDRTREKLKRELTSPQPKR